MISEPTIISVARLPTRSTRWPAKGAQTIDAKMMIELSPPAVENMWRKLLNASYRNPPDASATRGTPHLSAKKSVDRAVKGKIAE